MVNKVEGNSTSDKKEETTDTSKSDEDIEEDAKKLYNAFYAHNLAAEQDQRGLTEKESQDVVSRIYKSSNSNKFVFKSNNVEIYVNDASIIETAFTGKLSDDLVYSLTQNISLNGSAKSWTGAYPFGFVKIIKDGNSFEDDESLTEEEKKIAKYLDEKYPALGETNIRVLLQKYKSNDGSVTVEWDENGEVRSVYIDPNLLSTWGINGEVGNEIIEEEGERIKFSELGGILLEPVFALINFVADAVMSNLDTIMTEGDASFSSVAGLGIMQENAVPQQSGKTYETYTVDMEKLNVVGDVQYPNIRYTPEEIFLGKIDLLSIDFISGKNYEGDTNQSSGWLEIRKVISQWYQVLRMVAIIGLLSVLIYTGIKVMISANAKDKAKYKEWIMNWLMAAAILFSMHIIMAFIVSVTGEFSKLIGNSSKGILINGSSASNLIGLVRFMIQADDFYIKIGYEVMYIALIWYTLKFTFVYLKRVLNMAFLTLIAPIVALTYTLDKINDGKAQGFEMWLKEYIFNALLQPMHCILYYVLVGSAVQLAAANPIYGIVVLAFMAEAEKLLKKIFGFDKASGGTVGGMAGAFAAGAVASNIAKMAKGIGGGKGGNGNKGADGVSGNSIYDNPKALDNGDEKAKDDALFSGNNGDNGSNANDDESDKTAQQRMFDADEENGEFDDDPAYREQMAREAYGEQDGNNMTDEERREMLREQGWSEEDINDTLGAPPQQSTQAPIHQVANNNTQNNKKRSKFAKGAKAVVKKLAKPVWDADHGAAYNGWRLARKVGRAALGASLGIGAAAVQAGISITDGKYSPFETIASFTGGYAAGNRLEKGVGNGISGLAETYREGRDEGDKEAIMKRAQARWAERDDVIKYNKKYNSEERKDIINVQKQLLEQGITDPKEMDKCIKYMKESGVKMNNASPDDIRKARVSHDFSSELSDYGINPFKADDVQKYKATMTKGLSDKDRIAKERLIDNKMNAVREYRTANKPK